MKKKPSKHTCYIVTVRVYPGRKLQHIGFISKASAEYFMDQIQRIWGKKAYVAITKHEG